MSADKKNDPRLKPFEAVIMAQGLKRVIFVFMLVFRRCRGLKVLWGAVGKNTGGEGQGYGDCEEIHLHEVV